MSRCRPTHRRPRASRRAVTLVELTLVIALTLILSAVAIGGLRGLRTWRAAAAVRRVQADLTFARNQALLSGRRTWCVFDLNSQSYELRQESQPGRDSPRTAAQSWPLLEHPATGRPWRVGIAELASDLRVSAIAGVDDAQFGFGPDGLPMQTSGAAVRSDIELTFVGGSTAAPVASLAVRAGSGRVEALWP